MAARDPRVPRRRGVAFSDPLVVAIARREKSETRRLLVKGEPRYEVGDELYVREAWAAGFVDGGERFVRYRADGDVAGWPERIRNEFDRVQAKPGWRPPRFMFRALARYWLLVLTTRVEHLHAITDSAIHAEGIHDREAFARTWNRLHTEPGSTWAGNPLVEVVRFRLFETSELCAACGEPLALPDRDYCVPCEEAPA